MFTGRCVLAGLQNGTFSGSGGGLGCLGLFRDEQMNQKGVIFMTQTIHGTGIFHYMNNG